MQGRSQFFHRNLFIFCSIHLTFTLLALTCALVLSAWLSSILTHFLFSSSCCLSHSVPQSYFNAFSINLFVWLNLSTSARVWSARVAPPSCLPDLFIKQARGFMCTQHCNPTCFLSHYSDMRTSLRTPTPAGFFWFRVLVSFPLQVLLSSIICLHRPQSISIFPLLL